VDRQRFRHVVVRIRSRVSVRSPITTSQMNTMVIAFRRRAGSTLDDGTLPARAVHGTRGADDCVGGWYGAGSIGDESKELPRPADRCARRSRRRTRGARNRILQVRTPEWHRPRYGPRRATHLTSTSAPVADGQGASHRLEVGALTGAAHLRRRQGRERRRAGEGSSSRVVRRDVAPGRQPDDDEAAVHASGGGPALEPNVNRPAWGAVGPGTQGSAGPPTCGWLTRWGHGRLPAADGAAGPTSKARSSRGRVAPRGRWPPGPPCP